VFTQTEKFATLAKALPKVTALVKTVVCWGAGDAAAAAAARELGMAVHSWEEFLALGRANPAPPVPPKPEDLCTIMYTRCGSTCVRPPHRPVRAAAAAASHPPRLCVAAAPPATPR
jgi:long-subunit acyl-CoA synthetase (AMP-forming)